jgi:hypothetical protein
MTTHIHIHIAKTKTKDAESLPSLFETYFKNESAFKAHVNSMHSGVTWTNEAGKLIGRVNKRIVGVGTGLKSNGMYFGGYRK